MYEYRTENQQYKIDINLEWKYGFTQNIDSCIRKASTTNDY